MKDYFCGCHVRAPSWVIWRLFRFQSFHLLGETSAAEHGEYNKILTDLGINVAY